MKFNRIIYGDVHVISLNGKLIGEPETTQLHDLVELTIKEGGYKIILDLKNVEWMGSVGFGTITGCLILARRAGGDLRLAGLNKKVVKILTITKLNCVFQTYNTVTQGVSSYQTKADRSGLKTIKRTLSI